MKRVPLGAYDKWVRATAITSELRYFESLDLLNVSDAVAVRSQVHRATNCQFSITRQIAGKVQPRPNPRTRMARILPGVSLRTPGKTTSC